MPTMKKNYYNLPAADGGLNARQSVWQIRLTRRQRNDDFVPGIAGNQRSELAAPNRNTSSWENQKPR